MRREEKILVSAIRLTIWSVAMCLLLMIVMLAVVLAPTPSPTPTTPAIAPLAKQAWTPPDSSAIPNTPEGDLIRYGRELVAHTSVYLGPSGKVAATSNGMNCQNCHLKAGKKPWGNSYAAVASTYPKFRPRSGTVETVERRVNDCIERSLNGKSLPVGSHELNAIVAYIRWVGKDVPPQEVPKGTGIVDLDLLEEAASPEKGKSVYESRCARCHGSGGKGIRGPGQEWLYPPLWGPESFNTGAGLYRLSRMAGFVKVNMPNGVRPDSTLLSDEEAWNVAAFINSQPRPQKDLSQDWPDIATKPFDYPFGPYADSFSEEQHKLGPFSPILAAKGRK
jgi:thiosulfate dehydrogenase